ncbi:Holliday junction branch migration protein RuvA [Bifidobacterium criceti]|uniref:Holliday junction branch migration complex subunit RuvA n=1 Tax=Bifidobacterium criceti TaxID=1960969 RepID=A0A2A2ED34_9BIFI|nr:Holliday junction branch migration protein RuvA [Bifidobacterium criceti]PAU66890.1 ATP-dependent DNA helicase RuvA [Bifidobacterium criceti]
MIGMLSGTVAAVDATSALIDVNGVGFEVRMPSADLATLHVGAAVTVMTSMSVAQDAITLFGFLSSGAKRMFLQLQKVSGIGPKVALSLLSTLPSDALIQAIHDEDATALAKAPGLGKKGAQKIILELKGSIDLSGVEPAGEGTAQHAPEDTGMLRVIEGLISLGWKQQEAQQAVDAVIENEGIPTPLSDEDVSTVLRLALASMDRGR